MSQDFIDPFPNSLIDQQAAITLASTIAASLSIFGALFVILIYGLAPQKNTKQSSTNGRQSLGRLILSMAVADLISAVAYFIGIRGTQAGTGSLLCTSQSFMEQYGDLASICFTASLACNVMLILFKRYSIKQLAKAERFYYFFNFGVTFLIAGAPVVVDRLTGSHIYGATTLWCWIPPDYQALRFALFYIPLWLIFLFNVTVYGLSGYVIYKKTIESGALQSPQKSTYSLTISSVPQSPSPSDVIRKQVSKTNYRFIYIRRVFVFLIAFILTWLFATVNRVHNWVRPDNPSFVLEMMQVSTTPLRGFLNFLAYFVTSKIWKI